MSTETSISPEDKEQLVRDFFIDIIRSCEDTCTDIVYEDLPEDTLDKYPFEEIVKLLNLNAVAEVISLGVKQKYGVDLGWEINCSTTQPLKMTGIDGD